MLWTMSGHEGFDIRGVYVRSSQRVLVWLPCAMHLVVALWAGLRQPGSSQRRPPPWALHLVDLPARTSSSVKGGGGKWCEASKYLEGERSRKCAKGAVVHVFIAPSAPLVHPGSWHRRPPGNATQRDRTYLNEGQHYISKGKGGESIYRIPPWPTHFPEEPRAPFWQPGSCERTRGLSPEKWAAKRTIFGSWGRLVACS